MSPDYFNSIVTFVVGLLALVVYGLSKRHEKKSAATIIVMDIRHAEQVVLSLLERGSVDRNLKPILHENNWAKYKHLFVSEFSYDDYAALNRFFDSCVEIAEAKRRMNEVIYSAVNAKGALLQQKILEISDIESLDGQESRAKLIAKFNAESYAFDPIDPKTTVLQNLSLMGRPSTSMAFIKLKKIAGIGV
jgi:hypothetical protein